MNSRAVLSNRWVFNSETDDWTLDDTPSAAWASSLEAFAPTVTQRIAENRQSDESWTDTLQRLLPALTATVQQREILKIQLERARAGLPPLDNSQFGVGVNVGLDPGVKTLIMVGGGLLLALLAFRALRR